MFSKQEFDYTYWKVRQNNLIKGWPDHVLADHDDKSIHNVTLLGIDNNLGDHRAIGFKAALTSTGNSDKIINKPETTMKYYWSNGNKTEIYSKHVEMVMRENATVFHELSVCTNKQEAKAKLDVAYKLICQTLISESGNDVTDKSNTKKRQSWWTPVLSQTHVEVCLAYRAYRDSNFDSILKKRF